MSVELPPALAESVEQLLHDVPPRDLARASAELSARYREKRPHVAPVARSQADLRAYVAARLPATFAAVTAALAAVREQRPDWRPQRVLDLGAGPGTGLWSAATVWPSIERCTAVEVEPGMMALGRQLATVAVHPAVRAATWTQADVASAAPAAPDAPHDLVLLAYVLGELPPARIDAAIDRAHAATVSADGITVIVEPGTPAGYARIIGARQRLLERGGTVSAPCPHDAPCPIPDGDWCHFSERLARTASHRAAKGGALGYEDEKFAYVAVSRGATARAAARIIRHPQIRPGNIRLELCTATGLQSLVVTKRDRDGFRLARKAAWGDPFAPDA